MPNYYILKYDNSINDITIIFKIKWLKSQLNNENKKKQI